MNVKLMSDISWEYLLKEEKSKLYFKNILSEIENQRKTKTIFPSNENIFNVFKLTPFEKVKVVIIGQDPYHGIGQAHGLAFSVLENTKIPPSLANIFKEIKTDLNLENNSGDLTYWAKQGVFLLNSCLSVIENKPGSHSKLGWQIFTDFVIKLLSDKKENLVFLLWGSYAISKKNLISDKHLILTSPHPSPLSAYRGFLGCKHFSQTNNYLKEKIIWGY